MSCIGDNDHIYALLKEVPLLAILTRNISSDFIPEFCQYVSTILEKKPACFRPLKNRHFVAVCTERMMDYQYRGNGARNIYSNYNQMRAYVECSPNQSKKNYTLSTFPSSNLRNFEDSGIVLTVSVSPEYLSFTRVLQFSSNSPGLKDGYHYCMCTNRQLFL